MGDAQLVHFASDDLLAAAVADDWLTLIGQAQAAKRKHLVALSGGRITKKLLAKFIEQARARSISLTGAEFFWADERCVPPDDPESNYRLAVEFLFKPANIADTSIHRIQGEADVQVAARSAAADLNLIADKDPQGLPVLDLVLLGMGEDGHVASLFPGDAATEKDATSVFLAIENSPKPPPKRVSLGHGVISAAREVWVLASGSGKEAALRESLALNGRTPLAKVIQRRRLTKILTDIHF